MALVFADVYLIHGAYTVLLVKKLFPAVATQIVLAGPDNVAVISAVLGSGRRTGLYVAVGVAIGAFFWVLITAYGLAKLFELYPQLIKVFAIAGGGYLSYLGIKAIRNVLSRSPATMTITVQA